MWDGDPPWTLPGVEGKKAKGKGKKILTHFTEISVWDGDPPWTLPGVEGKKAEDREKNSDSFYGNFSVGRRPSMDTD